MISTCFNKSTNSQFGMWMGMIGMISMNSEATVFISLSVSLPHTLELLKTGERGQMDADKQIKNEKGNEW